MPIHVLWIVVMVVGVLPFVALVVVLVTAHAFRGQPLQKRPMFSPDGRWWWDGRQWQPIPQGPPLPATHPPAS